MALEVAKRLVAIKRDENAADVLFDVGRHEEAVNVCLAAKCFEKAKALAKGNAALKRRVEELYESHLVANENTNELMDIGKAEMAIDVAARQGNWDKVWDVAAKAHASPQVLGKYVLMRVDEVILLFLNYFLLCKRL